MINKRSSVERSQVKEYPLNQNQNAKLNLFEQSMNGLFSYFYSYLYNYEAIKTQS